MTEPAPLPSGLPSGSAQIRAFVPAKDFARSRAFYERIGFSVATANAEVVVFHHGEQAFILQNFHHPDWAANFMMQLMVEDMDGWWAHLEGLDLPGAFGVPALRAPAMQPWGLKVGYLVDPSGVLWHVAQHPRG